MTTKKNILAIIGSASQNSANLKIVETIKELMHDEFDVIVFDQLKTLPHFDPELSINNTPDVITSFRNLVAQADGMMICTPEYVFSMPSGLKNAIEWCISTTVFSDKPTGLITASASGEKGHEQLQLIMKTAMAKFNEQTTLLIPGVKGKFNREGQLSDQGTMSQLTDLIAAFKALL